MDPINLQGKIHKHNGFEAEVATNKRRIDGVAEVRFSTFSMLSSWDPFWVFLNPSPVNH